MKVFVKYNRARNTFSGTNFFTGEILFEELKKIPYSKKECIIYHGKGLNIHPAHWKDEWFEKGE